MTLNIAQLTVRHEPFPLGVFAPAMDEVVFDRLAALFPGPQWCREMADHGKKLSLSSVLDPAAYAEYLRRHPPWAEFLTRLRSPDFLYGMLLELRRRQLDLGLMAQFEIGGRRRSAREIRLRRRLDDLLLRFTRNRVRLNPRPLHTRFEFSLMPADGGCIKPHTDAPNKLITIVIAMNRPGEWDPAWGGSTDMLKPLRKEHGYNYQNARLEFDQVATVERIPLRPNQGLLFIKTHDSLHAVAAMSGPAGAFRKTLTINVETR